MCWYTEMEIVYRKNQITRLSCLNCSNHFLLSKQQFCPYFWKQFLQNFWSSVLIQMHPKGRHQGFGTRMVYLDYITCLRYTILVWNPRHEMVLQLGYSFSCTQTKNVDNKQEMYRSSKQDTACNVISLVLKHAYVHKYAQTCRCMRTHRLYG